MSNPRTLAGHKQTGSGREEEQVENNHKRKRGPKKSNRKEKTQRKVAAAAGKERVKQVRFGHLHTQRCFWHAGYHSGTSTIIPLRADTETERRRRRREWEAEACAT